MFSRVKHYSCRSSEHIPDRLQASLSSRNGLLAVMAVPGAVQRRQEPLDVQQRWKLGAPADAALDAADADTRTVDRRLLAVSASSIG